MVEVLKQGKNVPLPVEDQIIIIFAAAQGFMDDLELKDIARFGKELVSYVRNTAPELLPELKAFSVETEAKLKSRIKEIKATFNVTIKSKK